jgi:hypothetical protein
MEHSDKNAPFGLFYLSALSTPCESRVISLVPDETAPVILAVPLHFLRECLTRSMQSSGEVAHFECPEILIQGRGLPFAGAVRFRGQGG